MAKNRWIEGIGKGEEVDIRYRESVRGGEKVYGKWKRWIEGIGKGEEVVRRYRERGRGG